MPFTTGRKGLRRIAQRVHLFTAWSPPALAQLGFRTSGAAFFDTLHVTLEPARRAEILRTASPSG
jgi:glycine cleavage system pyridoxal-binding protein P